MNLARRAVSEGVGTALLLAVVVGSGIMAERLAGGNAALALLANALATGGGLVALILSFGPISGAQFNPLVTLALAATRRGNCSGCRPLVRMTLRRLPTPWRRALSVLAIRMVSERSIRASRAVCSANDFRAG